MLKKYLLNTSGNFSIMFSIVITTLLIAVGAAVDISGSASKKSTLQDMSDAAALAAVSSDEDGYDELLKIVNESLAANNFDSLRYDVNLVVEEDSVTVLLTANYETLFLRVAGQDQLPISVLTEARLPEEVPINIALVLDRTGSMRGDNMDALKAASAVLIDEFAEYDSDTRVAVVPFSNYVNVGMHSRSETWIDVPPDGVVNIPAGECFERQPRTCTNRVPITGTEVVDGVIRPTTRNQCTEWVNTGPPETFCPPAETRNVSWSGCIGSRDGIYNEIAAYGSRKIPGILGANCGEEVLPLTRDLDLVKTTINSLTASKETYIPVGLINGWRMLDPEPPFVELTNADKERRRTLVLMTDGQNTLSLSEPYIDGRHRGADSDQSNDLTQSLCNNIKDDNIDIWSVAYNFEGADTKDLLRDCASNSSQFFDASDREELIYAFEQIGNSLFAARLSR